MALAGRPLQRDTTADMPRAYTGRFMQHPASQLADECGGIVLAIAPHSRTARRGALATGFKTADMLEAYHGFFCTRVLASELADACTKKPHSSGMQPFTVAERSALEPVLSQNITQSKMPINNQTITIIIKSKYYRISLAISIFGCIFGCRISNTPSHEHQTKHHFCT